MEETPKSSEDGRKKRWATKGRTGCKTCRYVQTFHDKTPSGTETLTLHIEQDGSNATKGDQHAINAFPQSASVLGTKHSACHHICAQFSPLHPNSHLNHHRFSRLLLSQHWRLGYTVHPMYGTLLRFCALSLLYPSLQTTTVSTCSSG